jgi:hypothetical protein
VEACWWGYIVYITPIPPNIRFGFVSIVSSLTPGSLQSFPSIDRSHFTSDCYLARLPAFIFRTSTDRIMATSKFVEILDTNNLPYSHDNVSLDDVLEDARHRSSSSGSISPAGEISPMREAKQGSQESNTTTKPQTRLRGFSMRKGNKT